MPRAVAKIYVAPPQSVRLCLAEFPCNLITRATLNSLLHSIEHGMVSDISGLR